MKFPKQLLCDLAYDETDEAKLIESELVDVSRWSIHYRMVFKIDNKFYSADYRKGATESQDESPFEYDPEEIECEEVFPQARTIIVYEPIP